MKRQIQIDNRFFSVNIDFKNCNLRSLRYYIFNNENFLSLEKKIISIKNVKLKKSAIKIKHGIKMISHTC